MGFMILEANVKPHGFVELCGSTIKYWENEGLPTYEGSIEGFKEAHPEQFNELLERKLIKES